jgi:hypothetical protein
MFVMYANELDTPAPLSGRPLDRREKRGGCHVRSAV